MSLHQEKLDLRRVVGELREALTPPERVRRTADAVARLLSLGELQRAAVVAGYAAKGAELDVWQSIDNVIRHGRTVVCPRVTERSPRLCFHRVIERSELRPQAFGVAEPQAGAPEVPLEAIDVFLVPGLAFDSAGGRLGYGGGYYDEVIARVRARGRGLFVGCGYDFQLVDTCPRGQGDQRVDCVVTDARVVRCGPPGGTASDGASSKGSGS